MAQVLLLREKAYGITPIWSVYSAFSGVLTKRNRMAIFDCNAQCCGDAKCRVMRARSIVFRLPRGEKRALM